MSQKAKILEIIFCMLRDHTLLFKSLASVRFENVLKDVSYDIKSKTKSNIKYCEIFLPNIFLFEYILKCNLFL